jgi:uncharacterized lipoprotein YddW (UPF0748 family)
MKVKQKIIPLIITLLLSCPYISAQNVEPQTVDFNFNQEEEVADPYNNLTAFQPLSIKTGEVLFKQVSYRYDLINPTVSASHFPGGRGANKLVVYTKKYGTHTGTNEFGTEAVIEGNTVTALSGADSTIPENGVVISGHGVAKNWITQNVTVGSKVYIDTSKNTITVYTTSESYTYEANAKIAEAQEMMDYYKNNLPNYNYNLPSGYIQTAKNYLMIAENEKQNSTILKQYTQEAIDAANMAIKTSLPFIKSELKGTWVRPTETSREQIVSTIEKMKANGFDSIFLETYFHGKTIFPSKTMNKYGFTIQNEIFEGIDPLEIWIQEAHKRDMKVHIWFQSFYVGNKAPSSEPTSILSVRPDWGNKTQRYADTYGATKSTSEHNGYFIDPANPEVQDFLLELLDEIITTYKPDGINLDYIRYPNATAGSISNSWGYTEYARNDFKEEYGVDPVDLTAADVHWYDWNQYRRNNITNFVKKVGELGKEKQVYISAVIFPDLASALATKQQDWRNWSMNNYIDGFTPLFLTYDPKMLVSMMNDVMRIKSPRTDLFAGLFVAFMGGAPEDLVRQIYQTRMMSANGVIIFDYAHTTPAYSSTLMVGAFNNTTETKTAETQKQKKKFKRPKRQKEEKIKQAK